MVVPHLNQPDSLRRCLESLERQTYPRDNFEVVVVDNGSKVFPSAIVTEFANVKLEKEPQPGPGPARNHGVAASRGNFLAFIDADCIADEGWLTTIAAGFGDEAGKRVLGGDVRIALADPKRLTQLEAYESIFAYRQEEYIRKFGFSGTGNLAVRRSDFDVIGPFGGIDVAEDREWGRRANALGYQIIYLPQMIVYHPARNTFVELYEKWDRHIDHDAADFAQVRFARIRWLLLAGAIAVSPVLELPRILGSTRVSTMRDRWQAFTGLARIRLYRTKGMIVRIFKRESGRGSQSWNRG